jgi:hypothetical protein
MDCNLARNQLVTEIDRTINQLPNFSRSGLESQLNIISNMIMEMCINARIKSKADDLLDQAYAITSTLNALGNLMNMPPINIFQQRPSYMSSHIPMTYQQTSVAYQEVAQPQKDLRYDVRIMQIRNILLAVKQMVLA